jgi:formylmethanofuran dehydrogenase subunit E
LRHVSNLSPWHPSRQYHIHRNVVVCGRSAEFILKEIERFHGFPAPGVVIGAFMVDWAQEEVDPGIEYDAIVETYRCLPDAVQLFTPCTFGNGWMRVLDWDRLALTLYDRNTRHGIRVWLDAEKTILFTTIHNWFLKLVPKHALPLENLLESVFEARRAVLSTQRVVVTDFFRRPKKDSVGICLKCGEAFDPIVGDCCKSCQCDGYFKKYQPYPH